MRRLGIVALALAMVLAGCPAMTDSAETLTPAPVPPIEMSSAKDTATCAVPSPPDLPGSPPPAPVAPAAIPTENGTVNVTALLARHEATLREQGYRLDTPMATVKAAPNRTAVVASSRAYLVALAHYVVDDHQYTYAFSDGAGRWLHVKRYDSGSISSVLGTNVSLTGVDAINRTLGTYPHEVARVRDDNWTVLRASLDENTTMIVGDREIRRLNSTVLVDTRGIVRSVERETVYTYLDHRSEVVYTSNVSISVTDVGNTSVERPPWVCDAVRRGAGGLPSPP